MVKRLSCIRKICINICSVIYATVRQIYRIFLLYCFKAIGYILIMRLNIILPIFVFLGLLVFLILEFQLNKRDYLLLPDKQPIIVWWTPFYHNNNPKYINCGISNCIVTENKDYVKTTKINAYIFYGSNFDIYDLPLPKDKDSIWALIHEESPKNVAVFLNEDSHSLFNLTATFSRFSHFPITLQYVPNLTVFTDLSYFRSVNEKNKLLNSISPVLYMQSDCVTPLERDPYVVELMKYISIDSYGKCLQNKDLPDNLQENYLEDLYGKDLLNFTSQYKFVIAFENAICDDYITEKLWRPLISGSIPIYLGSPTVKDWLPNNNSAIIASEFDSPRDLAEYILKLNSDNNLYNMYLKHKIVGRIDNNLLKENLLTRQWTIDSKSVGRHFIEQFECFVCENINKNREQDVNRKIYNCPDPISPLSRKRNESNWWSDFWREGKCQAKILKNFVMQLALTNYTKNIFDNEIHRLMIENKC